MNAEAVSATPPTPPTSSGKAATRWRLPRPHAALQRRIQRWFESRLAPSDSLALTQRNVYIVPTRAGWMLALTLLVLLVASINYQLNLGYLLTFMLAGSTLVGMHISHATLRGLALSLVPPPPQHAGIAAAVEVKLTNSRRSTRHGIGLAVMRAMATSTGAAAAPLDRHWVWADVPAQGSSVVHIAITPPLRGLHALPTLTAETRFPLGTFRVWTVWRPAAQILVYPAPESKPPPLPPGEPRVGQAPAVAQRSPSAGDYDGVRAYRRGDPMKLVVWKKAAQAQAAGTDDLVSRDTQQAQQQALWLDAQATGLVDVEGRLSRLCAWVLIADRLGVDYGLRVAGRTVAPNQGEAHKRACLEVLATC